MDKINWLSNHASLRRIDINYPSAYLIQQKTISHKTHSEVGSKVSA